VVRYSFHKKRPALAAVPHQPKPKIRALARSPDGSPGASHDREVQKNDSVGSTKPNIDGVVWPKVSVQDPRVLFY
jgi:hypothetical protein